jgi:hypothetical protein
MDITQMHLTLRNHHLRDLGGRGPSGRLPSGRRYAIAERTAHHEDEVDQPHRDKSLPNSAQSIRGEMRHEQLRQRGADHRPAAEAHDRHAGGHAAPVRKSFYQCRYRGNITQTQADST